MSGPVTIGDADDALAMLSAEYDDAFGRCYLDDLNDEPRRLSLRLKEMAG